MLLQIKDRKHIERIFIMLPGSSPGVGLGGAEGSQKLKRGDLQWHPIDYTIFFVLGHFRQGCDECPGI